MTTGLCIVGDRDAVGWVLTEERMVVPARSRGTAAKLRSGDRLLIYTTKGCYRSGIGGRVITGAEMVTPFERLEDGVVIAGREFDLGCRVQLTRLAPFGKGVELKPLVADLALFPDPAKWRSVLHRSLVVLPSNDGELLARLLREEGTVPSRRVIKEYASRVRP